MHFSGSVHTCSAPRCTGKVVTGTIWVTVHSLQPITQLDVSSRYLCQTLTTPRPPSLGSVWVNKVTTIIREYFCGIQQHAVPVQRIPYMYGLTVTDTLTCTLPTWRCNTLTNHFHKHHLCLSHVTFESVYSHTVKTIKLGLWPDPTWRNGTISCRTSRLTLS